MERQKIRIKYLFCIIMFVIVLLLARLFYIQIIGIERTEGVYASQHNSFLTGINFRADILDRNGNLLVNNEEVYYILLDKFKFNLEAEQYLNRLDAKKILIGSRRYYGYKSPNYNENIIKKLKSDFGGFIFHAMDRYSNPQLAAHIIGYCNSTDNTGTYGLERAYDVLLKYDAGLKVSLDSVGRILPGKGISYVSNGEEKPLKTTLDSNIQRVAEKVCEENNLEGAAVVIVDVEKGGILSSLSYPYIDNENIAEAKGDSLINKALQSSYPPGSVFKIIVAAAALEEELVSEESKFECKGYEDLYGILINCSKKDGHGVISFKDAFAKSCNSAFITLGQRVGGSKILEMAEAFGLGSRVIDCLEEEKKGVLPVKSQIMGAGIGNLSIGQGELEITCIQAAKIAGVIACGGMDPGIHLIDEDDEKSKNKRIRVISAKTADVIKGLMAEVSISGTGKKAGINSAGKSGSAQSVRNGNAVVHGWYIGFFPVNEPKYIVSVFTQNSGGSSASIKIFREIKEELSKIDNDL